MNNTLEQKLREARLAVIAAAKEACKNRGFHNWDNKFGNVKHGGGEPIPRSFGDTDSTTEYTPVWSHHERECIDCGHKEVSKIEGREWLYDEGLGHFYCDPRNGTLGWYNKKENKSYFVSKIS
jgi:hypothetical protein